MIRTADLQGGGRRVSVAKRRFSSGIGVPVMVPRHEMWRKHYRSKPYARHLSRVELNRRMRDIILNMLSITPDAKVGLVDWNNVGKMWMEKFTHGLEEMVFRYGPYPNGFDRDLLHSEPFPNFASELTLKATHTMKALRLRRGQTFIKLGQEQHMRSLFEEGGLRIQPASYFSSANHNGAVRDDEMSLPISFSLSREDVVRVVTNPQVVLRQIQNQRLDIEFRSPTDFYLYCITQSVDPRLFADFSYDACVVIRDKKEFGKRLKTAVRAILQNFEEREGEAVYVDPLLPKTAKIFVPLSKPFGYAYQDEYRYAWLPKATETTLAHIDLKIGSIADIAELVVL